VRQFNSCCEAWKYWSKIRIAAAVLAFGLHLIGHNDVALYDGSWAEWGRPGDTPVET